MVGYSDLFCYGISAISATTPSSSSLMDGWVDLPLVLTGRHALTIYMIKESSVQKTRQSTYFIQQVKTFPASSWLWSQITYPSYGAIIDSRRLLVKLRSNAAMLQSHDQLLIRLVQVRDLVYDSSVDLLDTLGQTAIEPGDSSC